MHLNLKDTFSNYFTDSLVNAYDYVDGELKNCRLFVDAIAQGFPEKTYCDGLCVDDEGGIWSSRYPRKLNQVFCRSWGGFRVVRFTKDGELDFQIERHCLLFWRCVPLFPIPFLSVDTLKVRKMTGCISLLPTAEPGEVMQLK
jgi:sugar lactone lactonase YvrE